MKTLITNYCALTSEWSSISRFLIEREEKVAFAKCPQNPRARRIFTSQTVSLPLIFQRVPVPSLSTKPYVISPQTPCAKGSLMIQASVWVAIWASPAGGAMQGLQSWCVFVCVCVAFWLWKVTDLGEQQSTQAVSYLWSQTKTMQELRDTRASAENTSQSFSSREVKHRLSSLCFQTAQSCTFTDHLNRWTNTDAPFICRQYIHISEEWGCIFLYFNYLTGFYQGETKDSTTHNVVAVH